MNLKKCFSAILAAAIVCGNTGSITSGIRYIPNTVIAADKTAAPTIWDGTADITWYDDEETEFHITTAEQLAGIASLVNKSNKYFEGKTIILDSDIYMNRSGKSINKWTSISDFKGTFKGSVSIHLYFKYI